MEYLKEAEIYDLIQEVTVNNTEQGCKQTPIDDAAPTDHVVVTLGKHPNK